MSVPNLFATVTTATGSQLDANFAATCQLNALNIITKKGDQTQVSSDASPYRRFVWDVTASGALYTLLGEFAMDGGSHNTALNPSTGDFVGRDEAGPCSMWAYVESDKIKYYYSATQPIGTVPVWSLVQTFDISTGSVTIAGNIVAANVGVPPFFIRQFFPTY
jgi:hypothetical protein